MLRMDYYLGLSDCSFIFIAVPTRSQGAFKMTSVPQKLIFLVLQEHTAFSVRYSQSNAVLHPSRMHYEIGRCDFPNPYLAVSTRTNFLPFLVSYHGLLSASNALSCTNLCLDTAKNKYFDPVFGTLSAF